MVAPDPKFPKTGVGFAFEVPRDRVVTILRDRRLNHSFLFTAVPNISYFPRGVVRKTEFRNFSLGMKLRDRFNRFVDIGFVIGTCAEINGILSGRIK